MRRIDRVVKHRQGHELASGETVRHGRYVSSERPGGRPLPDGGDEARRSRCRQFAGALAQLGGTAGLGLLMRQGWSDGYVLDLAGGCPAWFCVTGEGRWREVALTDEGRRELVGGG